MTLHEPDVALTDLGLALECAWFTAWLVGHGARADRLRGWFICFFAATGLAAFLSAVTHGLVPDRASALYRVLWVGIYAAIGMAAVASWAVGSRLVFSEVAARRIAIAALIVFAIYLAIVLFVARSFVLAILHYLSAALFLLVAFMMALRRRRERFLAAGVAGVALTFLAALVQQSGIGLAVLRFDHNALYHLIQAVALFLIFLAARGLLRQSHGVAACARDASS